MNDNKPVVVTMEELHSWFRKDLIINALIIGVLAYWFKMTPSNAGFCCLLSVGFIFLTNLYLKHKIKSADDNDVIDLQMLVLKNSIAMMAYSVLSLVLFIIGICDIPALIKPYI